MGTWEHKGLIVEGLTLAGIGTCLILPQYGLAFDIAQGPSFAIPMQTFLITHGHLDHAAGIPYIISQKAMNSHRPARFVMPPEMVAPMINIMRQWSEIEGHTYDFEFLPARVGEDIPLRSNFFVRPFTTVHRIPSTGYSLCRRFRKLRDALNGTPPEEIAELRKQGQDPTEEKTEILVSFTGDTQIDFLDRSPEVRAAKVLILEATYLDERRTVENAKNWGHTHLDELIPRLPEISSEKILLIHTSARYSFSEAATILEKRLPFGEKDRVVLFPGRLS